MSDDESVCSAASAKSARSVQVKLPTQTSLLDVPNEKNLRSASPTRLPTDLALKVRSQLSRFKALTRIMQDLATSEQRLTLAELNQTRIEVDDLHKVFLKEHAFFEVSWPAAQINHEYFTDEYYERELVNIQQIRRTIAKMIDATRAFDDPIENISRLKTKMPDIPLPDFDGDYDKWPAFSESFQNLILNNTQLANVDKLQYLKGCLKGSAVSVVKSLPITGSSLEPAWEALKKRYESKRLILQSYLDMIVNAPPATIKSPPSLHALVDSFLEAQSAITKLEPVENHLGCLLVHLMLLKVDRSVRTQWENSLGQDDTPTLQQLTEFLRSRAHAGERVEAGDVSALQVAPSRPAIKPAPKKVHHSTSQPSPSTSKASQSTQAAFSRYPCDVCGHNHYVATCDRFHAMDPKTRLQTAIDKRLCFNCLGRHSLRDCKITRTCKKCPQKHHTLLHDAQPTAASFIPAPSTSTATQ